MLNLEYIYGLCSLHPLKAQEQLLFALEHELSHDNFKTVNDALAIMNLEWMNAGCILVVLSITWHGKDKLTNRQKFYERAEDRLIYLLGSQRTEALLRHRK